MTPVRKVLVTGSGGLIAGALTRDLGDRFEFTGLDIGPLDHLAVPNTVGDLSDIESVRGAFDGVDAVVHLGADSNQNAPWSSVLPNNLIATRNVFEACRDAGVKRVVYASSNHAVGMHELDDPYCRIRAGDYEGLDPDNIPQIDHRVQIRPDGQYGISKAFGEATGAYYAENFGLEVACLRIGTVNRPNRPTEVRQLATWCSHRDVLQLVQRCLEVEPFQFDIFYGVSDNKWRFWDIDHARQVLGYAPEDNGEDYRDSL
ncbi:MAG: NAD(P)-dependent oxidoreductase [Dehalococcoidia bacterium]|jgi:nucleoside-diphosphate-sugar epimerase|nr:NAD(P)-dependent oxidoreductase [Dehalococcoidia bacterium]